jgi:hypothetical protein
MEYNIDNLPKSEYVWLIEGDTISKPGIIDWIYSASPTRAIARHGLKMMKAVSKINGYPMKGRVRAVPLNRFIVNPTILMPMAEITII